LKKLINVYKTRVIVQEHHRNRKPHGDCTHGDDTVVVVVLVVTDCILAQLILLFVTILIDFYIDF
jgi:hypothetical protein